MGDEMIASKTVFQPRLFDNPEDLLRSHSTLAVYQPDTDDQGFDTAEEALEAGLDYLVNVHDDDAMGIRRDLMRMRITCDTTITMPLPISDVEAINRIREKLV